MLKNPIFSGAATALITPMNDTGVDYADLDRLIDWQIEEGIDALVIAGTTGESATLSEQEHRQLLTHAGKRIAGRVPFIAGTGSNNTAHAIEMTKFACDAGADACLTVTPYYNKATQIGLLRSFETIADASSSPLILYNVPSRTGTNILPDTCGKLAKHPNIAAIKEASGNISQIAETLRMVGNDMSLYSGNDDQIIPIMALGGIGVISVLSNLLPKKTAQLCRMMASGETAKAAALQLQLLPLIGALFCEVNPIPVKAAMAAMGYCKEHLRLPLTVMEPSHRETLLNLMHLEGLL